MDGQIDYGRLMRRAMHGLIREVLADVARSGLPGEHHFYVTFATDHPDVQVSEALGGRHPEEMTIVLQHEFYDLTVDEDGFSVTLSFGDHPETLRVPFGAVRTFVDPSVSFGLQLEADEGAPPPEPEDAPEERGDAEVVSLDKFRK